MNGSGEIDSTAGRVLTLLKVDPGLIPSIPYGPPNLPRIFLESRSRNPKHYKCCNVHSCVCCVSIQYEFIGSRL